MKDLLSSNHYKKMRLLASYAVFSILAVIAFSAFTANAQSVAPQATFPADGASLGAIPDPAAGSGNICGDFGANKDVTFTVSGQPTGTISDVRVNVSITHSWVGDLDVRLLGPGGAPSAVIFSATGSTTAAGCGDDSNLTGPYNFFDTAPASPTWLAAATTATGTVSVASGDYRVSTAGGVVGGNANALLTPTFAGVTNPNGTWTLRIRDGGEGDTGSVTAATLTITQASPPGDAANDINGDGRSDYTVVRNVGGGANGQIRWFYNTSGTNDPTVALDWGLASDGFFLLEDYDGDGKDDITVWRSGTATFYTLLSQTMTARIDPFGQTGDDPTVAGDYDGDGKADSAVYRAGAMANDPSTWYYRGSLTPANVTVIPWGKNGDFPSPGDYDGDGKYDFVIQRNNGGGQAAFWRRNNDGSASVTPFGTPTDVIVPGDYDGDGKCDIATVRGVSGQYQWMYLASSNSSINYITFGASATDLLAQGDYNGDGKTDVGIWRPSASPGGSFYVYRDTVSGSVNFFTFGQNGDYPVNNWNRH